MTIKVIRNKSLTPQSLNILYITHPSDVNVNSYYEMKLLNGCDFNAQRQSVGLL